jgi:cell division protein FtsX
MQLKPQKSQISYLITPVIVVILIGLALNAYYQSKVYYNNISPKCEIAAFVQKNSTDSISVISERLLNTEGVAEVSFIDQEQAFKKAVSEEPETSKIMITKDNPLTPYFIIIPSSLGLKFAQEISDSMSEISGIDEVRFDTNLFLVTEELGKFYEFYMILGRILFIGVLLFISAKYFWRWLTMRVYFKEFLSSITYGAVSGFLGAVLYFLLTNYALPIRLVQIPFQYFIVLFLSGILVSLSLD